MVVPFIILGLVGLHILLLHKKGSTSPIGYFYSTDKLSFFPYFVYKDLFGLILFYIVLGSFIFFNPNFLVGHPDNYIAANSLVTPLHIVPEWYFLPYYAILRSIPDKLGGVLAMGLAIVIFFAISFLDHSLVQSSFFRPNYEFFIGFFILVFIILKMLGCMPIEEPFSSVSQYIASIYFIYLFFILPFLAKEEKLFHDYLKDFNSCN